jgi:hypothetical protein
MAGRKNPAWVAINKAIADRGVTKKQLEGEVLDRFGMPQRTFYHQQERGYFDENVAAYLGKRLGIPAVLLREPSYVTPGINDDLILGAYAAFRDALTDRGLELSSKREARAFLAWFRQCVRDDNVDPQVLDSWLEASFDE